MIIGLLVMCLSFPNVVFAQGGEPTEAGKFIADIIGAIVSTFLLIGLALGIGGLMILFAIGVLKLNIMPGIFRGEAMRTFVTAMEVFAVVPAFIGILYLLDYMAVNGMLGSSVSETGSFAWVVHQVWSYVLDRLTTIFSWLTGGGGGGASPGP